jgi:hypothetical protein
LKARFVISPDHARRKSSGILCAIEEQVNFPHFGTAIVKLLSVFGQQLRTFAHGSQFEFLDVRYFPPV